MIHLPIHLALEALEGGPIHPRWMFPFERFMKKLKGYVRNKAKPEGSIAEGYVAEEALTLSSHYFRDVTTKFNRLERNVDPPPPTCQFQAFRSVCNTIGLRSFPPFGAKEFNKARWYVLHNSPEIDTYRAQFQSVQVVSTIATMVVSSNSLPLERNDINIIGSGVVNPLPHDLADSDVEDLINDDDGVEKVYSFIVKTWRDVANLSSWLGIRWIGEDHFTSTHFIIRLAQGCLSTEEKTYKREKANFGGRESRQEDVPGKRIENQVLKDAVAANKGRPIEIGFETVADILGCTVPTQAFSWTQLSLENHITQQGNSLIEGALDQKTPEMELMIWNRLQARAKPDGTRVSRHGSRGRPFLTRSSVGVCYVQKNDVGPSQDGTYHEIDLFYRIHTLTVVVFISKILMVLSEMYDRMREVVGDVVSTTQCRKSTSMSSQAEKLRRHIPWRFGLRYRENAFCSIEIQDLVSLVCYITLALSLNLSVYIFGFWPISYIGFWSLVLVVSRFLWKKLGKGNAVCARLYIRKKLLDFSQSWTVSLWKIPPIKGTKTLSRRKAVEKSQNQRDLSPSDMSWGKTLFRPGAGFVAGERFAIELTPSTFPQRHVAGETYPQRNVAGEKVGMLLGKASNVVLIFKG
ncbi:hypothetical protein Tco_0787946 [Tanacetum coccineum]